MNLLIEKVQKAVSAMAVEGIVGWGLCVPKAIGGQKIALNESKGCTSDRCAHNSHDPAAPDYKWIPDQGDVLSSLGDDYYHLQQGEQEYFLHYSEDFGYWDSLMIVDDVPEYLLAALAK